MEIRFDGEWSSIRPLPEVYPTDMRRNGAFRIEEYDSGAGTVSGTYYDLEEYYNEKFSGTIKPTGSSYHFWLEHRDPFTGATRHYDGDFIAEVNGISIIAGTWKNVYAADVKRTQRDSKVRRQDEGVWVATKP